jgi:SAM-dependent methyltransferase
MQDKFDSSYYDSNYFAIKDGKKFNKADGSSGAWSYANPEGEWLGCEPIVKAWKEIFKCGNMLDIGCGRGTFVGYARAIGIKAYGFDFSEWAVTHLYPGCESSWIACRDATKEWGYPDDYFDLVTVLDLMEHLYTEDIDRVIDQMYRVAKRYVFMQIATVGGGSGSGIHDKGYILKRGEPVPVNLECMAVAGHVTVQDREFWTGKLTRDGWVFRDDIVEEFIKKVPGDVLANWVKNTLIVLEKRQL